MAWYDGKLELENNDLILQEQDGTLLLESTSWPIYGPMTIKQPSCYSVLQSKKVPWVHKSATLHRPGWLGGSSAIKSITYPKGKFSNKAVRSGGSSLGNFGSLSRSIGAAGAATVSLTVKERICSTIYNWDGDTDLDVRHQACGHVDDPVNWEMIKRLCTCSISDMSSDGETVMSADDDGETLINMTMNSAQQPFVIYRIAAQTLPLYGEEVFADYEYPDVAICSGPDHSYYIPAANGVYSMYMLANWNNDNVGVLGAALLPHSPIALSSAINIVVAVLSDGSVYWSNDYGRTFYASTGISNATCVSVHSYSNILLGTSTALYRSTDGGRTFSNVDPYNAISASVVTVVHQDDKIAYAISTDAVVAASEDGGETFIRLGTCPVMYPKDMIILDGVLMVGGYTGTGVPVIYGSDDTACSWQKLLELSGTIFAGTFTHAPAVKLASCGCGVIVASVTFNDNVYNIQHSQLYRNVNWGAPGCWEPLWEDYRSLLDTNGMYFLTDVGCAGPNDVMAVGRILGADPLYFGLRFSRKEELQYGKEW